MMKKHFLLAACLSCVAISGMARPISRAEARLVAQELVGISDATSDADVPQAPYYIFSRGAGQGFVIVSGDDRTAPILGYTEQGDFAEDLLPEPLQLMLGNWAKHISLLQKETEPLNAPRRAPKARAIAAYKSSWADVPVLIQTHWNQGSPYNDLAPVKEGKGRCMTGCVATAGSQVIYYFHKDNPDSLLHDTPTYSYGTPITTSLPKGTPVEWDLMRLSGSGTTAQNHAVAVLMYAAGTSAWLTYGDGDGTSTSGHNYKMADAMNSQFRLSSSHADKSSYSQQGWEQLIYNNLKNRQPMLYSGVHPTDGGHSVVLDGYQASTGLYHFNFGWGGQGDGYYTVDDETGMNGFNSYQDLIYNIKPQKQNLTAQMTVGKAYQKAPCQVQVTVQNRGTLDYKNIYLYASTRPTLPNSASVTDTKTYIPADGEGLVTLTFNPAARGTLYIFACDDSRNILDSCQIEVLQSTPALRLDALSVDAGSDVVDADGMSFVTINNTQAHLNMLLTNADGGTYCQTDITGRLESYNADTKEWVTQTSRMLLNMVFDEGQCRDTLLTFSNLTPGTLYRAYLDTTVRSVTNTELQVAPNAANMVYFTVREPDMSVVVNGRQAIVTGRWNQAAFSQELADAYVSSYDFTGVTQLTHQPVAANPNALFYVADNEALLQQNYTNVVVGQVCPRLVLRSDAEFAPMRGFTAREATFTLVGAEVATWEQVVLPFAIEVPYGMQMLQPKERTTSIIVAHDAVRQADALTPVVFMADRPELLSLKGTNVAISEDTLSIWLDGLIVGRTVKTIAPAGSHVFGINQSLPSFLLLKEDAELAPFRAEGIFGSKTDIRATGTAVVDRVYAQLADSICRAYSVMAQWQSKAPAAQMEAFQTALRTAEDIFTYRTATGSSDIKNAAIALGQALAEFVDGVKTGIEPICAYGPANGVLPDGYYSLSGQRLTHPTHGLVIMRRGGQVRKVFMR